MDFAHLWSRSTRSLGVSFSVNSSRCPQKSSKTAEAGFTLVELIVVVAIIVVITAIVLADNNRFGGRVLLQNFAYDVALSVRQAQVYGISVQRFGTETFSAGFGVHFSTESESNRRSFVLFADGLIPPNGTYGLYDCPNPSTSNCEYISASTMSNGYRILDLCGTSLLGVETCGLEQLDVLFKRPEPDAWISTEGTSCIVQHSSCQQSARIVLESPRGDTANVILEANGQISVQH